MKIYILLYILISNLNILLLSEMSSQIEEEYNTIKY